MAQGTEKILGGTPYKRYPDPASPGTANAQGLYPWSVFKATICSWNGVDAPTPQEDLQLEGSVELLLFTSDIPAFLELRATDLGTNLQFSAGAVNVLSVPFLVTTRGGTTPSTIPAQGKVISGYTGGLAEVYCTGFPASAGVLAPGVEGRATYTEVICIANGPVIASPVGPLSLNYRAEAEALGAVPVIIDAQNYTAAARDAGNLIAPPGGRLYQIVGLWAPQAI